MNLIFEKHTLSNGITLIVKENHHTQSVVVRGRLQGGSNVDPADKAGLASFATTMMRRGTSQRTFAEINETVESLGASIYVNCGQHLTTFGGKSLAEDFDLLVELMADNLLQPTFPPQEIEKVRGQIITGLKQMEDSTRGLSQRHFRQILYGSDHPYGRSLNGTLESIPIIDRADLLNFWNLLHPQDGMIVVVGDVKAEVVLRTFEAILGQWQPDHTPPDSSLPTPQPLAEPVRHIHPMLDKSQVDVVLGCIGPSRTTEDYYAAYVGDTILGQLGLGGRIGKNVRDTEGMAYYARTNLAGGLGPAPWYVYAGVNPSNVDRAIELMLAEVHRFREEPVTDQELADAKSYLTGILPLQMETNEGVASILLQIHLFQLGDDFITRYPDLINAITKADVQAAAQNYLSDEVYAMSIAGPYEG